MFKTAENGGATGPNEYVCFTHWAMAMVSSTSPLASREVAKAWDEYRKISGEYGPIDTAARLLPGESLCIGEMK